MASKASKPSKSPKGAKKPTSKSPSRQPAKAKSKSSGRSGASGGGGADLAASLLRPEVMGAALVLLAVFTLLALVTGSRGGVTEGWVGVLRSLFGSGVWGIPLVAGALGLWLIIRAIERMPNMSWQRPVGFGILFLAVITAAALRLAPDARLQAAYAGEGGGELGSAFADGLQALLGSWGAWAAVTFLFILGIVFLADRILIDAWYWLSDWGNQRARTSARVLRPCPACLHRRRSSLLCRCQPASCRGGSDSWHRSRSRRSLCHRRAVRYSRRPAPTWSARSPRDRPTSFWRNRSRPQRQALHPLRRCPRVRSPSRPAKARC